MSRKGTAGFRSPKLAQKLKLGKAQQSDRSDTPNPVKKLSVVDRSVLRSGLSYDSFVRILIQSALSRLTIWTQADLDRLLLLSERLGLDPLNNEIYATEVTPENGKKPRVVFVVGVDGWSKIINSHPQFDGMKFVESAPEDDELPLYIECTIYRKDRRVATSVREYMYEAHTNQGAWLTHPRRMLRHKAMVQCARASFGLGGVYEPDEAARITSNRPQRLTGSGSQTATTECVKAGQGSQVAIAKDLAKQQGSECIKNFIRNL
jgi:phage recombination protein Bet